MNWFSMAHGAFTQSMTIVTVYDTLGIEGLRSALKQTKPKAIFVDSGLLPVLNKALDDAPSIQDIILNNESTPNSKDLEDIKSKFLKINILPFDDLQKLGEENPSDHVPPGPEDLACIMYTSGTSGAPKGVTIKHKAIIAAVAGADSILGDYVGPDDSVLAYLPQAHIIEFVIENGTFFWGVPMGYGSPRTLTDTSVRNCKGDLLEFCPTVLVGVPAVWETIKKGITAKVNAGGAISRFLFWGALAAKQAFLAAGFILGVRLLDAIVFDKVRAATGGKLRFCMSGGGPVAKDTQRFISMAIRPMISGYGLTETGGMGALNDPLAWTSDALGDIPASVEVKLVDYADAGYFTSNNPPQGEVWVRGAAVTERYHDNEEETAAAIRADGWFLTGDIGEFDGNGHLRLIDRKKNLVKTLNGEYIALEKLESVYRASSLLSNVCVYAAPDQTRPVAIVVPVEAALVKVAREKGVEGLGMEELIGDERVRGFVLEELQKVGKKGGLAGFEIVEGVVLDGEEWTPSNVSISSHLGYLTAGYTDCCYNRALRLLPGSYSGRRFLRSTRRALKRPMVRRKRRLCFLFDDVMHG